MIGSRFLLVEHRDLLFEGIKNIFEHGMISARNQRNVFCMLLALYLSSSQAISVPLSGTIEPTQEKTGTLSLLSAFGAAQVQENVRILPEEFLYNAYHGLPDSDIAGGGLTTHVDEVEPIGRADRIGVKVKIHEELEPAFTLKIVTPTTLPYSVWGEDVDVVGIKWTHGLRVLKMVGASAFGFCSQALFLFPLQPRLSGNLFLAFLSRIEPLDNFIARTQLDISHCLHDIFIGVGSMPQRYTLYANHSTSDRTFYTNPH